MIVPKLQLKFNGAVLKEYVLDKEIFTIGRKDDNDVVIDNPAVSGHHARLVRLGEDYAAEDLNSTNGTFLKGQKIVKVVLSDRDEVGVARHTLLYLAEAKVPSSAPPVEVIHTSEETVVMSPPVSGVVPGTPVPALVPAARVGGVRVVEGDTPVPSYTLAGLTTYIGKSDQATVPLKGFFAPATAACIYRRTEGYFIKALKQNYVYLNREVLSGEAPLKEGDLVDVGSLRLMFFLQDSDAAMFG